MKKIWLISGWIFVVLCLLLLASVVGQSIYVTQEIGDSPELTIVTTSIGIQILAVIGLGYAAFMSFKEHNSN